VRAALIVACAAGAAGCAAGGDSPRAPYAMPTSPPAAAGSTGPEFVIADSAGDGGATMPQPNGIAESALAAGRLGLFPAERFALATGGCSGCAAPQAALWWFRGETIAVPSAASMGDARAGGTGNLVDDLPAIVWLGAPQRISGARLSRDAAELRVGARSIPLALTPPIATNAAYVDASTARYFSARSVAVRGAVSSASGEPRFIARTIFPEDQRIDLDALHPAPLKPNEYLGTLLEAQTDERYRLLHARSAPAEWRGLPAIAFVLTGAQGDDDGSRAGHLAVATGVLGERGEWDQWLVTNFYPLLEGNAKGIIPATLPMDNYLYDLNSGQLYYRPGYMLVAVLSRPRAARAVQRALQDTMLALQCGRLEFDRARRNSTAMTIDPLRELGWRIPAVGATSRIAGAAAAPVAALVRRSLRTGGSVYATFAAERTRLLPRVAFEVAGHDLLALATSGADDDPALTAFERVLAEDLEALLFVRLPQVPSSRRFGTYPEPSLWAYGTWLLAQPGDYEPAPNAPDREFPERLRGACGG